MTPVWSPEAIEDLAALRAYIEQDDPASARRVALHIIHNVEILLPANPEIGRAGRVPGTRELVIPRTPFIVPYRLQAEQSRSCVFFTAHAVGPSDFD
jgi:toxin ParE1/3/4